MKRWCPRSHSFSLQPLELVPSKHHKGDSILLKGWNEVRQGRGNSQNALHSDFIHGRWESSEVFEMYIGSVNKVKATEDCVHHNQSTCEVQHN